MKGKGLAVFSEPASPVPGYDLSRIIADPEQSQEMKLTHAKLHYSRVRILLPSSVSNASGARGKGSTGALMAGSRDLALPGTAHPCSPGAPAALPWGLEMLCYPCTHGSASLSPHGASRCCKSKPATCQDARG